MENLKNLVNTKIAPFLIEPTSMLVLIALAMILFVVCLKRDKNIVISITCWVVWFEVLVCIVYSLYWAPKPSDQIPSLNAEIKTLKSLVNRELQAKIAYEALQTLKKTKAELAGSKVAEKEYAKFLDLINEANGGEPAKQYAVGQRFMTGGAHIKKDTQQGILWMKRAGTRGYKDALYYLANFYRASTGPDAKRYACYYMSLAASQRHEKATIEASRLCAELSKNDQEAIRDNVASWKPVK